MNFLCYFLLLFIVKVEADYPIVATKLGKIQGDYRTSVQGRTFAAFEGIPYAIPPIGNRRFQLPQPVKPWQGVWIANIESGCVEFNFLSLQNIYSVQGDEDCLYLNIYTPYYNANKTLDVIVYIHGGAFMYGRGIGYGPEVIMDKDVVYVNFNYRLGILGFLSTEDNLIPGNNGLKDQLLALKWIKRHIKAFGGNPTSITVVGMSAGGASAHILYLSPQTPEGLFQRGFSQSGTALNPWVLAENSLEKAKLVASYVGCPSNSSLAILTCLKQRLAYQIVATTENFLHEYYDPYSPFGVVIDKWAKNPILPEHPLKLLRDGKLKNIPWMFSMVESEGLYPAAKFIAYPNSIVELDKQWDTLLPYLLDFHNTVDTKDLKLVAHKIRDNYFNGESLSWEKFPTLVKMIGDRLFAVDIETSIRLQASRSSAHVYFYYFSYRGTRSITEFLAKENVDYGASHGDDTFYVLTTLMQQNSTEKDKRMSEVLKDIWITFAKNGKPEIRQVDWLPVLKNKDDPLQYLHLISPDEFQLKRKEDFGNKRFWNTLPIKENFKIDRIKN